MQTQEDHSNPIPALNVDSLKVDLVFIQNTCSKKEDSNFQRLAIQQISIGMHREFRNNNVHAIKYKMSKAKERCMAYFRSLHSHLQVLSKDDLKGTRIEHGFKRAFMSLFGQDADTFTSTMLLNVDQLQKQLDKDEFQEDGSMAAFWMIADTIYDEEPMNKTPEGSKFTMLTFNPIRPANSNKPDRTKEVKLYETLLDPTGKRSDSCTSKVDKSEPPHGLDDGVAASFQRSRIHKPHAHTQAFKVNPQVDQGSQIKMIHVKEMMQDNDLKNSKSKHKGSKSRSQSMNEQSRYKQDKTKTRQSINVKSHIFNVKGDNDKSKQTPTRMSSVVRRSLKKETSTLGEIVSLNYIKSNMNVIGLTKSN
ncbi:hypothetical protein Tco_0859042 [Tanacetum coccineum]|uniref:Uncharacterized protein n=1 Tax=Tanacetum coccineum TaxID=301880 RepID=A0ABQ5BAW1_9ASTR